jgi:hypothetical protein
VPARLPRILPGARDRRVPSPVATPADASDGAGLTEVVTRPDPGIAQGKWEAPAWVFVAVAVVAVLGGLGWLTVALRGTRRR